MTSPTWDASGFPIAASTPQRRRGSVRRTYHMDIALAPDRTVYLDGAVRDLLTDLGGAHEVLTEVSVRAVVAGGHVTELSSDRDHPAIAALTGAPLKGLRRVVADALPDAQDRADPLLLLLDEISVCTMISNYIPARQNLGEASRRAGDARIGLDVCIGWRTGGVIERSLAESGRGIDLPVIEAAHLGRPDDPLGWHPMAPLPVGVMRRRRRIDVHRDAQLHGPEGLTIEALHRDSHGEPGDAETVLHEYALEATTDMDLRLVSCHAVAGVLPTPDCHLAAPTAQRPEGRHLRELRTFGRLHLSDNHSCTHLTDLIRALADVDALSRHLGHPAQTP